MSVKGYKVIGPDWTCRGFKYEVGKTYKHTGAISLCKQGFHFCKRAVDCFSYYPFNNCNHVVEVIALGLVKSDEKKSVTDEIMIVREIKWQELLTIVNEGEGCTGFGNIGDYNVGCWNVGNNNTGYGNIGDYNVGSVNVGSYNVGHTNFGSGNTGDLNLGSRNSGDWNSGNWNSGFFCTDTPKVRAFNVQTDLSRDEWLNIKGVQLLNRHYRNNWWIHSEEMTDEEKKEHPEHERMGGYLKIVDFKEACAIMWKKFSEEVKQAVRDIPYFNAEIFKEITGIDVTE